MSNMTIENIGQFIRSGDLNQVTDRSTHIEAPQGPDRELLKSDQSSGDKSFLDMMKASVDNVNQVQLQADRAAKELAAGRNKNIHETMLMLEKADMSFKLMMQVRNKVIEAYREIMRMQV